MTQTPILSVPSKSQPVQGEWTYEDYLSLLPDDGRRYEIIEGVLYVTNAPSFAHQFTVAQILAQIHQFTNQNKLGVVLTAPFEVHLSEKTRPVQPDVLFIGAKNWPAADSQVFEGVPDLIVEVLSPSSVRTDRHIKFDVYEQAGVPEYWIVNPKTHSVEVYTLSGGEYAQLGEYAGHEAIQSAILEGLLMTTSTLFNPVDEDSININL